MFPDDNDDSGLTIDALASGLDTFATSEYNYAAHLKTIVMETTGSGDKSERAYRHYHYNQSCGKFMNTLFYLTLRRARSLESFKYVCIPSRSYHILTFQDGTFVLSLADKSSERCTKYQISDTYTYECSMALQATKLLLPFQINRYLPLLIRNHFSHRHLM